MQDNYAAWNASTLIPLTIISVQWCLCNFVKIIRLFYFSASCIADAICYRTKLWTDWKYCQEFHLNLLFFLFFLWSLSVLNSISEWYTDPTFHKLGSTYQLVVGPYQGHLRYLPYSDLNWIHFFCPATECFLFTRSLSALRFYHFILFYSSFIL